MMLATRCQLALTTIGSLVVAQRIHHQRSALRERTMEWDKARNDLAKAFEQANWLNLSPESLSDYARLQSVLRRDARDAARRLADTHDVASLAADPLWTRLVQTTGKAAATLRATTQAAWSALVETAGRPIAPAAIRAKVPSIPANREALARYERLHAAYERLAQQSAPLAAGDAAALRAAVTECNATLGSLSYDVPPAVQAFIRAVDARSATLSSLTPEVLQWLSTNGQLDNYVIRSLE